MSDTTFGFAVVGVAMLVVLGAVFVMFSRGGAAGPAAKPPRGVHLPGPSALPVWFSVSAALIGAGLAFRADGEIANPFLALPGLGGLVLGVIWWVRAANHEWTETERSSHGEEASH
ncbi:MAG: hypothetical protein IT341_01355 [Chloroflexi bacterium]|nr:hypothetical protein [Chloroflexota bacterium]